jgi:hypothetical protein
VALALGGTSKLAKSALGVHSSSPSKIANTQCDNRHLPTRVEIRPLVEVSEKDANRPGFHRAGGSFVPRPRRQKASPPTLEHTFCRAAGLAQSGRNKSGPASQLKTGMSAKLGHWRVWRPGLEGNAQKVYRAKQMHPPLLAKKTIGQKRAGNFVWLENRTRFSLGVNHTPRAKMLDNKSFRKISMAFSNSLRATKARPTLLGGNRKNRHYCELCFASCEVLPKSDDAGSPNVGGRVGRQNTSRNNARRGSFRTVLFLPVRG